MNIDFFLIANWKKTLIDVCYSCLSYLALFKVCLMAQFSISLFLVSEGWFPFLKWKGSLSFFPLLSSIWWFYVPVTLSVPMSINFMIKSISMLVLLQIKVTHFAKSCTSSQKNTQNTSNKCSIYPINPNISIKTSSGIHDSHSEKKK